MNTLHTFFSALFLHVLLPDMNCATLQLLSHLGTSAAVGPADACNAADAAVYVCLIRNCLYNGDHSLLQLIAACVMTFCTRAAAAAHSCALGFATMTSNAFLYQIKASDD